ncbi:hypothetical protein [Aquirufa aurantiipilula]
MKIPHKRSWFVKLLGSPSLLHYDSLKSDCISESENGGVVLENDEGIPTICINREEVERWFVENKLP